MNKKVMTLHCLLALNTSFAFARNNASPAATKLSAVLVKQDTGTPLSFSRRENQHEHNVDHPILKGIVFAPEVTMQGNTIYFVTPCDGYEFRLVKDNIIKYSTEIDDETLTIPDTIHGTYELQIVIGNYIFYTKVTLP
ncbi:MAG: hypothetical protein K2G61_02180 [Bacteroidaceae bacterium]|nr:hypothetical protein [Bacteroidaceae bacterium]